MITFESLLLEMADKLRLARWPSPEYTCHQASSYDRESKVPNPEDGKYRPEEGRDWGKAWYARPSPILPQMRRPTPAGAVATCICRFRMPRAAE